VFNPTTFDKGDFNTIVNEVKVNIDGYILDETERDLTKREALAENKFDKQIENFRIHENLERISIKVKSILEDSAPKAISFPSLEDDPVLFDWVQKGIPLHKDSTECKFCTKQLPESRIDDLNSFYSKKLKEIQDSIEELYKLIDFERNIVEVRFPNKKVIAEPFQTEYE